MPKLDWIGKDAVVNHHLNVPYHLVHCNGKRSAGAEDVGNLLVEGDNLVALKALLPYYAGQVKCIYIDPPYNTGDESWVYNDNVNGPEIRSWLGKVVNAEGNDLSRHDKWLCMMYPRLALLREFVRADGVIFVSIDENEVGNLRLLMDEVFGKRNSLGTLVWKRRSSSAMRGTPLSIDHEYVLAYARDADQASLYGLAKGVEGYPHEDERGRYASTDLTVGMGKDLRPGQFFQIANPRTGKVFPPNPERVWRFYPETMRKVIQDDLVIWPDETAGRMERPRYRTYFDPESAKPKPVSSWIETSNTNDREIAEDEAEYEVTILTSGMNQEGGRLLQQIMGRKVFAYPKPLSLIRSLVRATTRDGDIVLDSFAGTGTTGHAVLSLNQEDGGNRRFILVEMEKAICQEITAERLRRVVLGYSYTGNGGANRTVAGIGGGFRYCSLGEPLFNELGQIQREVKFSDLAHHLFFSETGLPLPQAADGQSSLIGRLNGTEYHLLWSDDGALILDAATLRSLGNTNGTKVVYAEGRRVSDTRLREAGVVFKQVPYLLKVS